MKNKQYTYYNGELLFKNGDSDSDIEKLHLVMGILGGKIINSTRYVKTYYKPVFLKPENKLRSKTYYGIAEAMANQWR